MIDKLTSEERMKKLILGEKIDRIPVIPHMEAYAAQICNLSAREYYLNPEKAFKAQIWAKNLHKHDGGIGYGLPEAFTMDFGGEVEFPAVPKFSLPRVLKRPILSVQEIKNLNIPNIEVAEGASRILKFNKICYENGLGVGISAGSPMNIVQYIVGTDTLLRWFIKEPNAVHELLKIATEYIIYTAKYYINEFGRGNVSAGMSFPMECNAIMSPKTFEKFSIPYIKKIFEVYKELGIKIGSIHLCGNHKKNLKYWKNEIKIEKRTLITTGYEMDLKDLADYFGEDYIIGGNVKNTTLQRGTPDEVYDEARQIIEKMKFNKGGFVLTPDCTLMTTTPAVNLHAMIKAARDFGSYD